MPYLMADEANAGRTAPTARFAGQCYQAQKELQKKAKAEFQAAITATPPQRNHIIAGESLPRVARR